ncbi:unnamed protein product [Closterium sp. NIES-53]
MASLRVLAFDPEGCPIQFDTWLYDLQLYLLSDSKDSVSLFDHTSGAAPAPPDTADSATHSQWLTRDAAARLAIRNHLHRHCTTLSIVSNLCTSDTHYRAALLAEFLAKNPPPLYTTLYFIVTCLPDSLRADRDHFLALDPTALTVDLLEQNLLAGETSVVAVSAARGTLRTPFFEGCSPSPLAPSYASAAAADVPSAADIGAASASAKCRSSKGKGGRGGGSGSGGGGGGSSGGGGGSGGGGSGGSGGKSGGLGGASGGSGGSGNGGSGGSRTRAPRRGSGGGQRQQQQRRSETTSPQQLREWFAQREASGGSVSCLYVIRKGDRAGQTCGKLHTQHRCFSRLDDAWRAEFGDEAEWPRWAELLRTGASIFDLDFDAILAAMYALPASAEDDCYLCMPCDPRIEAAALDASEFVLLGTALAEALHTFTLDTGASRCFFCDSTTLTPLSAPVLVKLADPSGGPVLARTSTVLPCPAVPSGSLSGLHLQDAMVTTTTPGGQRVSICTCTRTGRHLATFTRRPGSSLYTLATKPPQTLLWHHRLGHPSLPRLRGMHSRLLVSGLPRSLPPLPPSPAPPCLPCVEGQQCVAPHSSSLPPTTAPLQTLHMDVWGPARVSGQGSEHYFLLLRERFRTDLPVLRLHSDIGGEFSSDLVRDFCRGKGILQSFTLPNSPQKNRIAERRIGLVMEVARTSMIHAAAPHFLWPFAVRYAAHQLNLWPRVSLPETSPTLRWTGKVGDASVFRVWGCRAFVRDTFADKLSARAIPYVFVGFSPDTLGWQFYHPTSRRVFHTQDVTFDELVPFYRLVPYRSCPPPPPPLFLTPGPPLVDPLPPQGPAPSGVSQVASGSGATPGAMSGGFASGGAEPGGAGSEGAGSGGVEPEGADSEGAGSGGAEHAGAEPAGVEPGGAEPESVEPGGTASDGAESWGAEPRGTASSGGPAGAPPRLSPRPEPLSLQQLREWFAQRTRLRRGAVGFGVSATRDTGAGGAGVTARAGGTGGAAGAGPGAAGTGGVGGAGVGDPIELGAAGARGAGAVGAGAGGTNAGGITGGLTECRGPASHPASPVCTGRCIPCLHPPPIPGTHAMALRPSSVPLHVPLPPPPASSLPALPDPESDLARAASPTVSRLLTTDVTDPSFESTAASALVAELVDFAAAVRITNEKY